MKQTVRGIKEKFKIIAIFHKYKGILNNLINSSDTKSLDWLKSPNLPGLIDKRICNILNSKSDLLIFSQEDYKDEDILVTSFKLASKI